MVNNWDGNMRGDAQSSELLEGKYEVFVAIKLFYLYLFCINSFYHNSHLFQSMSEQLVYKLFLYK